MAKLVFFMRWSWPWPNDLGTQTWPRYGQDLPPFQNEVQLIQTHTETRRKHYLYRIRDKSEFDYFTLDILCDGWSGEYTVSTSLVIIVFNPLTSDMPIHQQWSQWPCLVDKYMFSFHKYKCFGNVLIGLTNGWLQRTEECQYFVDFPYKLHCMYWV